jgi:poly-gamma-glutamate system protein
MARAEAHIREAKHAEGVMVDPEVGTDPSGLIGDEVTPLMTTLGNLEAKRLSANPAWAAVLVEQLAAAGVVRGDLLAAGLSGSFPGLNLALMSACEALGANLIAVSSVTASTWGANQPGFTWPEMEARLVEARLLRRASIAVTAGGGSDVASDLDEEGRALAGSIRDQVARRLTIRALVPSGFDDAVDKRLDAIQSAAAGRPIRLYVNVGGAEASLGRSAAILRFRSGFLPAAPIGRPSERGVMGRLAARGVPALLLLNVRDLALRWGVPLS